MKIYLEPRLVAGNWCQLWILWGTNRRIEWSSWSWCWRWLGSHPWARHHHGTTCSRTCICHDGDRIWPSDWLARSKHWLSLPLITAHGKPGQYWWLEHMWLEGSGSLGMAPGWFETHSDPRLRHHQTWKKLKNIKLCKWGQKFLSQDNFFVT